MHDFEEVARIDELPENGGLEVRLGERTIGLFKVDGRVFAIDNECPHRGGPLNEGQTDGVEVICPWHGWTFHLGSGECTFIQGMQVACYPVRVEGEKVLVSKVATAKED